MAGLLALPTAVLLLEVLAATWIGGEATPLPRRAVRPKVAVLVPAHNEGARMVPTLEDIKAQLADGDRLIVVADNCDDDTAAVAAKAGAEVVERNDRDHVGKGYALDYGVRCTGANPPGVIIVIDADCRLADDTVDRLARMSAATARPTQALNLMLAPEQTSINRQVAVFAWRVKNWVRPLGLGALGLPCQLMGTGMALPWDVLRSVDLASGEIAEDLKLGLELTAAGHPPMFCPTAVVTSEFPRSEEGAATQRQRWEQGHIGLIASVMPRFLLSAIAQRNLPLLVLALDLAVPPVTLLALLLFATVTVTWLAALLGISVLALKIAVFACAAFAISLVLAWLGYGRTILPAHALLLLPAYFWDKCLLYGRFLIGNRATRWIRTDRR
jgi:cellulose synthase/poly-beta-1,6-N-acetylglucosamine synthase-like glycosyltransferase